MSALELLVAIGLSKDATPWNRRKRLAVTVQGRRIVQRVIPKTIARVDKPAS